MKVIKHSHLPITIHETTLSNGMRVVIVPRTGFHSVETILHVKFGSKDERNAIHFQNDWITLPQGTAHFLEHRIFESKGEQLSKYFAKHGASINASTGTTSTQYYFSTIRDFPELLHYFLNFIQTYQDNEEGVKKESGIIHREFVRRYESQKSQIDLMMMKTTYPHHHLSQEILGTESTILNMNANALAIAFRQYYRPGNLTLSIVGDVEATTTINLIEAIEKAFPRVDPLPIQVNPENTNISNDVFYHEASYDVTIAEDHVYLKFHPYTKVNGYEHNRKILLLFGIMRKMLLNPNAPLHLRWQKEGLISSALSGTHYSLEDSYWMMAYEVHTNQPRAVLEAFKHLFREPWDDGIMKPLFEGIKNGMIGAAYQQTDNLESLANQIVDYAAQEEPYFTLLSILPSIQYEDVKEFYAQPRIFEIHFFHIIPKAK